MDNLSYLFAAFAAVWVALFGYVLFLSRRQRQLEREVEALERMIGEEDG